MKPWLLDILACPIDKKYPLKLYIFSFENPNEIFSSILEIAKYKDLKRIKSENIVKTSQVDGELNVQDDIVLEKTPVLSYLDLIKRSLDELESVVDLTQIKSSKTLLNYIRSDIYKKIENTSKILPKNDLDNILPELVIINKYKFEIEIETGILFCPECKRWFPIIDTIPQMLPDDYRDKKLELEFLKTNKNLLDEKFLQQDLKPFNL
ncbi:MAG: hypothetical protein EU531_03225 [Promethearchaeota archaeon]|nr:MAG: hypothetical protein EU531_03225 [Candidatus Lokiarchaeota archaeon]